MFGYVLDEVFVHHQAPSGHPERPARVEAVRDALLAAGLRERGEHVAARPVRDDELARVHGAAYLEMLGREVPGRQGWLDADTFYSPGTWDAVRAAAGGVTELTLRVLDGALTRALAVVRPPGHHAERDKAMGFCLINNVAVAAAAARAAGAARVAVLDWDVHHGNGTQQIFWDDPSVMYLSVHQWPYYPGTGAPTEIGGDAARGANVNVGLPAGSGDEEYLVAFDEVFVPIIQGFAPDVLIVSAGFDAFRGDPLASMRVTRDGFGAMADRVRALADRVSDGRLVVALEGGYDLDGLAGGMIEALRALTAPAAAVALDALAEAPPPVISVPARAAIDATLDARRAA
ncbi:MAG: histone deacetylase [Kofleriaceae bacterium]|nr:histone deacetylase [Kofleriaceae bacterium]